MPVEKRGLWAKWILICTGWALVAVFSASQAVLYGAYAGSYVSWSQALQFPGVNYGTWAALTPLIFWFVKRFPFERARWFRGAVTYGAASFFFAALHVFVAAAVAGVVMGSTSPIARVSNLAMANLHLNVIIFGVVVGAGYAIEYYRLYQERRLKAADLEARLAQSQLQVLKMQLHPHFLFNALNTVSALVHKDVELADRMISRLGDLLRLSLQNTGVQEVSLKRELEFLDPYLEIEQARFGDRLKVDISIANDTLDAQVPNLLLQPLVENAIRHGIAPRTAGGTVSVRAERNNSVLKLRIRDDGGGLPEDWTADNGGVGLSNTRARLERLYGDDHRFELESGDGGGLEVRITIPFRSSTDDGGSRQ